MTAAAPFYQPPGLHLLFTEGLRGAADLFGLIGAGPALAANLPRGDGHAVLVLPGFLAGNGSTAVLRGILRSLGYRVYGWELGRNLGLRDGVEKGMIAQLRRLAERHGKISIIGQSLGGVFARELAKKHPKLVRQVISLGSPFAAHPRSTNAWRAYALATGEQIDSMAAATKAVRSAPPVPSTAIFSRRDGVCAWQGTREADGAQRENIEIGGSHVGMAVHPGAIAAIADRLAQQSGEWAAFDAPVWSRRFFPGAKAASHARH